MTKLSETQRVILSKASQRDDRLAVPPERLPAAARQTVAKALIKRGLVSDEHASAMDARNAWQIEGRTRLLHITDEGLRAIGIEPEPANAVDEAELGGLTPAEYEEEQTLAQAALDAGIELSAEAADVEHQSTAGHTDLKPDAALLLGAGLGDSLAAFALAPPLTSAEAAERHQRPSVSQHGAIGRVAALHMAAATVLAAWDAPERDGLDDALAALREVLAVIPRPARAPRPPRDAAAPRPSRTGTKQEAVLTLLRRDEGATITQVMDATGWQQHTVRGFLAGLKRLGIAVEVLERVRQVGPNKQGAKGSYSIYRIVAAPVEAG
ncbi:DUF3489 domain-containing protein [Neoroseomonas lacus]|uniref:DUF3489 domain-containing protein n=1 Tax=Neoroseomonas lacus TaxID=287609 RepID=A0A917L4P2_9PROT|nr:DUF3489 domain-containing protein [Neoroseomonas lacus]GGJ40492.1 hypothetical protein GCM10011320_55240 [Neoroseomonas lacus]